MDIADIISRLEIIVDSIEYEEININEVHDDLKSLIDDIETTSNFNGGFGGIQFDDLS